MLDTPEGAALRERLSRITAPDLPATSIFELCEGPRATRESRMEMVSRIAVKVFGCRVVGGFIRDWVIRGERAHLQLPFDQWIEDNAMGPHNQWMIKEIKEGVIPKDIDIELPMSGYFDASRFIAEVRSCGITVDFHTHIPQRHVFLFEAKRGPFTADFIEPHFAMLHTLADFDVNTLSIAQYPDVIGLKLEVFFNDTNKTLEVDDVISSCMKKELVVMRPSVGPRIAKMKARGWTGPNKAAEPLQRLASPAPTGSYSVTNVHRSDAVFKKYEAALAGMARYKGKLKDMFVVKNDLVDAIYAGHRREMTQNIRGGANEQDLFHGTSTRAAEEIMKNGFDDHYW